jgi:dGTPase
LLDLDGLLEVPLVRRHWQAIEQRQGKLPLDKMQRALVRDLIGTMVGNVLAETARRVEESGVETADEVRSAGRALACFSSDLAEEERVLKRFLYATLYNAPELLEVRAEAVRVVAALAAAYRSHPSLLPPEWRRDGSAVEQARGIGDFIAGMTDRFAIARHEELIGPVSLPDRF